MSTMKIIVVARLLFCVLFFDHLSPTLWAQQSTDPNTFGSSNSIYSGNGFLNPQSGSAVPLRFAAEDQDTSPSAQTQTTERPAKEKLPYSFRIAIYPAMAWAPIFGASV